MLHLCAQISQPVTVGMTLQMGEIFSDAPAHGKQPVFKVCSTLLLSLLDVPLLSHNSHVTAHSGSTGVPRSDFKDS